MTDISQATWLWIAKGVGTIAGSAISLAYLLPHDRREAGTRFGVGVAVGLVFGPTVGLKITTEVGLRDAVGTTETLLMGSAAASFCAWWALAFVQRLFDPKAADNRERSSHDQQD